MAAKRSAFEPAQLDLGFPIERPAAVTPIAARRRTAQAAAVGWHGIIVATLEVDWKLALELSPDGLACKVLILPRSPAQKAGLRSGDYVVSASPSPVADMALADLEARALPPGTDVYLKFHRPGWRRLEIQPALMRLRDPPKPAKSPSWKKFKRVAFGAEVARDDRRRFLSEMSTHPRMSPLGLKILTRLVLHYDGPNGIYPSYARIARDVRIKQKHTVTENISRLEWLGVVEIERFMGVRTNGGFTNRLRIHWPEGWDTTIVNLVRSK